MSDESEIVVGGRVKTRLFAGRDGRGARGTVVALHEEQAAATVRWDDDGREGTAPLDELIYVDPDYYYSAMARRVIPSWEGGDGRTKGDWMSYGEHDSERDAERALSGAEARGEETRVAKHVRQ